jgi:hypothetical protein
MNSLFGLSAAQLRAAETIGFEAEDFVTSFPRGNNGPPVCFLSFWADSDLFLYRHKETGLEIPYFLIGAEKKDMIADTEFVARYADVDVQLERIDRLRAEWECIGCITSSQMTDRYRLILSMIPQSTKIFMTTANERPREHFILDARPVSVDHIEYNVALRKAVEGFSNVVLIDVNSYIHSERDVLDLNHFRRDLYFEMYEDILAKLEVQNE